MTIQEPGHLGSVSHFGFFGVLGVVQKEHWRSCHGRHSSKKRKKYILKALSVMSKLWTCFWYIIQPKCYWNNEIITVRKGGKPTHVSVVNTKFMDATLSAQRARWSFRTDALCRFVLYRKAPWNHCQTGTQTFCQNAQHPQSSISTTPELKWLPEWVRVLKGEELFWGRKRLENPVYFLTSIVICNWKLDHFQGSSPCEKVQSCTAEIKPPIIEFKVLADFKYKKMCIC